MQTIPTSPTKLGYLGARGAMPGVRSPAQKAHLWANRPAGARRWALRYGSDVERGMAKGRSPRRKGLLSQIAREGYRG